MYLPPVPCHHSGFSRPPAFVTYVYQPQNTVLFPHALSCILRPYIDCVGTDASKLDCGCIRMEPQKSSRDIVRSRKAMNDMKRKKYIDGNRFGD